MLRSDLCDYNDAYTVVKGIVTASANERDIDEKNRNLFLKSKAPFVSGISKVNGVLIENTEDLDVVMPLVVITYLNTAKIFLCEITIEMN